MFVLSFIIDDLLLLDKPPFIYSPKGTETISLLSFSLKFLIKIE